MFDSYREPSVEPVYGVTEPIKSWSPLWANLGYFQSLFEKARMRRGWDRLWTWIAPPEWTPAQERLNHRADYVAYAARPHRGWLGVALGMFAVSVGLGLLVAGPATAWPVASQTGLFVLTTGLTWTTTRLFDGKRNYKD
jgi:hypothetical protein